MVSGMTTGKESTVINQTMPSLLSAPGLPILFLLSLVYSSSSLLHLFSLTLPDFLAHGDPQKVQFLTFQLC